MATVELKSVCKSFHLGQQNVLREVNLLAEDNEFLVIVGPSGCGKTTLLRLIAGLDTVSKGEILINNKLVKNIVASKREIAMVFQSHALYPNMSVFDNLAFPLKLKKMRRVYIRQRVSEVAEILGLSSLLKRKPTELSGGQCQRVAIGKAIIREPTVFLFDEPLSNLDATLRERMRTEILQLHRKSDALFIYVTHDQTEAMALGDRIVIINDGKILQVDTPLGVYDKPSTLFVAGFIGSPKMNLLSETTYNALSPLTETYINGSGTSVVYGIRPEHIVINKTIQPGFTKGIIELSEPLGRDVCLHVRIGNELVVCLIDRVKNDMFNINDEVFCGSLSSKNWHFFEKETGRRIDYQPSVGGGFT